MRIPLIVTAHSGDRDRSAQRTGVGGGFVGQAVTMGQAEGYFSGLFPCGRMSVSATRGRRNDKAVVGQILTYIWPATDRLAPAPS